ncbi:MAG TPA: insulinase family protein [Vicinamibacterales bacterium]|nr:insulinase family protein [Vicinamibacterales bacterium]
MTKRIGAALCLCGLVISASLGFGGAAAQVPDWPAERPPRPLPARDIKFPPYQIRTLPNGLQVVTVLHHEQPVVSMRMLVGTGTASDPKDKLGLARLLASLLDQGTTTRSAKELNDAIDSIGGLMGAGAASDLSFVNMIVMKDSFEPGMRMLSDMVERPAFASEEIDRQRQQMLSLLRVSLEDPEYIATAVVDRLVFGFNPYGMPDTGTPQTLAAVTRNDLLAFHQKYFVPNNAIFAIVGDVTADEAFATATKVFGQWQSRDVSRERLVEPPNPTRRVVVVDKPDSVQTEIRVGILGIPRNHPDYMALNLAVRILGGEGSNRLHQVLRTDRGLTYGAQADMVTRKEHGEIVVETNTRSDATGEVLRLIVDEFSRLQRERVSEGELASAKAYMTGSFPLTIETPDSIALQVLNVIFYGLPLEELQTFRQRVNRVTVDDIERVARFYLKPDAVSVALVGNASVFGPQLRGVGFGRFETVALENLDLLTADFKRVAGRVGLSQFPSARPAAAPALVLAGFRAQDRPIVAEEGAKAKALLDRVIAAKGGLATLQGIKSIKAVTTAKMMSPADGGAVEAESTTYLQYPNRVRVETKTPQGLQVQVYDGERGWVRDPGGLHDVPDAGLRDMASSLRRDTVAALLAADRGELRARLLPDVKDPDGTLRHALELSNPTLEPLVLYVDPRTGLIVKQAYVVRAPGQPLVEELFSDYRPVEGLNVAFAAEVRAGGKPVVTRRLNDITINAPLEPRLFARP